MKNLFKIVIIMIATISCPLFGQNYWEEFKVPSHGRMHSVTTLSDGRVMFTNASQKSNDNSIIFSFYIMDKDYNISLIKEFDSPGQLSSCNLYPYLFTDKYGSYVAKSGKKIYTNIGNSGIEPDTISINDDSFFEFDGHIFRFLSPTLFILDSTRKWQVYIDTLKNIRKLDGLGIIGDGVFYNQDDTIYRYDKVSKKVNVVMASQDIYHTEFSGKYFKYFRDGDTNLTQVYKYHYLCNYNDKNNSWTYDTIINPNMSLDPILYNNEFMFIAWKESAGSENLYNVLSYTPGQTAKNLFSFVDCYYTVTIAYDKFFISSEDFIKIYDFDGNLVKTVTLGSFDDDNFQMKVYDRNNILFDVHNGRFHYNLENEELTGLSVACSTAHDINSILRVKEKEHIIPGYEYTSDKGASWHINDFHLGEWWYKKYAVDDNDILYEAESNKVAISSDEGSTWQKTQYDFGKNDINTYDYCSILYKNSLGLLAYFPTGFFLSQDKGISWHKVSEPLNTVSDSILDVQMYSAGDELYTSVFNIREDGLSSPWVFYHSSDGGSNWQKMAAGLENKFIHYYGMDGAGNLYAADKSRIYLLKKNGYYWMPLVHNFEGGPIDDFDVSGDGTLFVYSAPDRLFRSTMPMGTEESEFVPSIGTVVTPNPAVSQVNIAFCNSVSSVVTITVFNVLGTKVGEFSPGFLPEGIQNLSWDCSGLPSGTYFLKIRNGKEALMCSILVSR